MYYKLLVISYFNVEVFQNNCGKFEICYLGHDGGEYKIGYLYLTTCARRAKCNALWQKVTEFVFDLKY